MALLGAVLALVGPHVGAARAMALEEPGAAATATFYQDVAWSPDGAWIAYSRYTAGSEDYQPENWAVYIARADGTEPRLVAGHATWVSWSPDGRRLAYGSPVADGWDLYAVDRDGGEPERLTPGDADERAPSWSPDGREIAFTSSREGTSDVYVLTLETGAVRRLTQATTDDHNPAWSPDGEGLVFYRSVEMGAADDLYWVAADGSGERRLTSGPELDTFPAYVGPDRVSFSRFSHDSGEKRLVLLDLESGEETLAGPKEAFFGRWSPDGSELLYIAGEWPSAAVYRMKADGSGRRRVLD